MDSENVRRLVADLIRRVEPSIRYQADGGEVARQMAMMAKHIRVEYGTAVLTPAAKAEIRVAIVEWMAMMQRSTRRVGLFDCACWIEEYIGFWQTGNPPIECVGPLWNRHDVP